MNVEKFYIGTQTAFNWFAQVAQQLGVSPLEFILGDFNILNLVTSVSMPGDGQVSATLAGGATMQVRYDPQVMLVNRVEIQLHGQPAYLWTGSMTVHEFLSDFYPVDVSYGSDQADWLLAENSTVYGGAGNDVIQMMGSHSVAYGQAGLDAFEVSNWGHHVIKDYEPGEKIFFVDYDSLDDLAADFTGLSPAAGGGFTLNFRTGGTYGHTWSLTLENTAPNAAILEDFTFGAEGAWQLYGPVLELVGISLQDLLAFHDLA